MSDYPQWNAILRVFGAALVGLVLGWVFSPLAEGIVLIGRSGLLVLCSVAAAASRAIKIRYRFGLYEFVEDPRESA